MKEEDISSAGTNNDAFVVARSSPAASSAGASSPAIHANVGTAEWLGHGLKAGSQPSKPSLSTNAGGSALGSSQVSCRPWERGDLLRRLATFNPADWFGKPKDVGSLACAQKGWINIDLDTIECESCGAVMKYESISSVPSEDDSAVEDFAKKLDGGHKVACPWRGNSCPESLVQFPPTPQSALMGGYKDRCDALLQFSALPVVSARTVEQMQSSRAPQIERVLAHSQIYISGELGYKAEYIFGSDASRDENPEYLRAQKLISLCGWESRWLPDIQDCEEHSAQSARNGYSSCPVKGQGGLRDPGPSKKAFSTSNKDCGNNEFPGLEFKCESRSPLLDCSLCGATVRIWDFVTVSRPARFAPNGIDIPETSKKMGLTRGVSAASGISGWFGNDGGGKERGDDHDEAATTGKGKLMSHAAVDLNLTMGGSLSPVQLNKATTSEQYRDMELGRDLKVAQPSGSEVGDRAASYESRGPGTRKRSADEGASTVDRPHLRAHQADSVEGTVIDRDGDEVNDSKQYSAGPSKRMRNSDAFENFNFSQRRDFSDAGPSRPVAFEIEADATRDDPFDQVNDHLTGFPTARESTHVSSVIAMDTVCHSADSDSLESVENYPLDVDDVNFPSASAHMNPDFNNEASELNYSNQAQQSACFQPVAMRAAGEAGVSSTNDGEEVVNTDTMTAHARDGISFGISGGSVGMGVSYEAEIHGTDLSIHRCESVVGDAEPVAEVIENQGQTGEFAPDQGQTDDFIPEEMDRDDPHGDSQDVVSRSVGRADSGSKIVGSAKAESVESGEKTANMDMLVQENVAHPSLSCNAIVCSGYEASKEEVTQTEKASPNNDCAYLGIGPPIAESNYDDGVEFDPIKHHNTFCPWVNGNVAAAGCASGGSSGVGTPALCGWQLTLDALDAFQTLGNIPAQPVESESAASRHKDEHQTPSRNLLACHSFSKSRGLN